MAINLLAEGQEQLVPLFGVHSGRDRDKLAGLELSRTQSGLPVLSGTCGWVECRILERIDSGDRMIYLADAVEQALDPDRRPLTKRAAFAALPDHQRRALERKGLQEARRDQALIRDFG
jgi:flavin reductase (DIM6/NTAB) family NADH-FMN oxidoreductase RutF